MRKRRCGVRGAVSFKASWSWPTGQNYLFPDRTGKSHIKKDIMCHAIQKARCSFKAMESHIPVFAYNLLSCNIFVETLVLGLLPETVANLSLSSTESVIDHHGPQESRCCQQSIRSLRNIVKRSDLYTIMSASQPPFLFSQGMKSAIVSHRQLSASFVKRSLKFQSVACLQLI